jgi:hypothetical protein
MLFGILLRIAVKNTTILHFPTLRHFESNFRSVLNVL